MAKKKAWGGRFGGETDRFVEEFTASIPYDVQLYRHDIAGSVAHARMLGNRGILPKAEADRIVKALTAIRGEIESGKFPFDLSDEDIHMAIERRLIRRIGPVGESSTRGAAATTRSPPISGCTCARRSTRF